MIDDILAVIASSESFFITAHEHPDGDAVGSCLALANFLVRLGKEPTVYFCDPVPENFRFLPMADSVVYSIPDRPYDVCFVLDAGEFKRAGESVCSFGRFGKIVNIDHHPYGECFGEINLIDPTASATGAIIYRMIIQSGHEPDLDTALCIYTAIVTDTGSFRYSNADEEAFRISGDLVARGINPWTVAEKLYESQPRKRLELLALALSTLTVSERGHFASVTVTLDMYEKTGATSELTDGFVNYPRSIHGVEVAVFFREVRHEVFKVGFRSKGKVNVSALAAAFGGGGHHNAAGCMVLGPLEEVRKRVFSHLETVF